MVCVLCGLSGGCVSISAHEARFRNLIQDRRERSEARRELSATAGMVLLQHNLLEMSANDPESAARILETKLSASPEPGGALALAELAYRAGLEHEQADPAEALPWYRDAALCASLAMKDCHQADLDVAIETHNQSVSRLIRLAHAPALCHDETWRAVLHGQGISLGSSASYLNPEQLADLKVASDLRVGGMDNVYHADGLGVPVVAHRLVNPTTYLDPREQFLPRELRTGATAVMVAEGGMAGGEWRKRPATLMFADPFNDLFLPFGRRRVSLANDRTTPLADQVARIHLDKLEWMGLFASSFKRPGVDTGLYMLRPYEPGKIPVVLVHGLFSSPRAYVQTINELSNTPVIASRYQFWVFLYPTGLPIPTSANHLREALMRARTTLDPGQTDQAFDQMVLVGHSMGGLLSKMMVQDSGMELWDSTISIPYDQFKFSPKVENTLGASLVYQALPFVKRVVFIASPHRGSPIASDLFGRTISRLVGGADETVTTFKEAVALNGPRVITPEMRASTPNAIGNLRMDSPVLAALNRIPIKSEVRYHSIIPQLFGVPGTDGVVLYNSSHLDGATSELIVKGNHSSQQKPEVTRELRRILLEHVGAPETVANTLSTSTPLILD